MTKADGTCTLEQKIRTIITEAIDAACLTWAELCARLKQERDEQRARADKADALLLDERRSHAREVQAARELLGETRSQPDGGRDILQCIADSLNEAEEVRRELAEAREQLARIEWRGGQRTGQEITPGLASLVALVCPECRGVQPSPEAKTAFTADQIGHRRWCWFAKQKATSLNSQTVRNHWLKCPARTADDVAWVDSRWGGSDCKPIERPRPRPIGCEGCDCARPGERAIKSRDAQVARANNMLQSGRLYIGFDFGRMAAAEARPAPKFEVGQKVLWGEKIYVVNRREWCPIGRGVWLYGAADSPGLMHEPDLQRVP